MAQHCVTLKETHGARQNMLLIWMPSNKITGTLANLFPKVLNSPERSQTIPGFTGQAFPKKIPHIYTKIEELPCGYSCDCVYQLMCVVFDTFVSFSRENEVLWDTGVSQGRMDSRAQRWTDRFWRWTLTEGWISNFLRTLQKIISDLPKGTWFCQNNHSCSCTHTNPFSEDFLFFKKRSTIMRDKVHLKLSNRDVL